MSADSETPLPPLSKAAPTSAAGKSPRRGRNCGRDLRKALRLRPKDIFELYGIPDSTLCLLCKNPDKSKRPPSVKIPGRKGRRGIRLFEKTKFEAWLDEHEDYLD